MLTTHIVLTHTDSLFIPLKCRPSLPRYWYSLECRPPLPRYWYSLKCRPSLPCNKRNSQPLKRRPLLPFNKRNKVPSSPLILTSHVLPSSTPISSLPSRCRVESNLLILSYGLLPYTKYIHELGPLRLKPRCPWPRTRQHCYPEPQSSFPLGSFAVCGAIGSPFLSAGRVD